MVLPLVAAIFFKNCNKVVISVRTVHFMEKSIEINPPLECDFLPYKPTKPILSVMVEATQNLTAAQKVCAIYPIGSTAFGDLKIFTLF